MRENNEIDLELDLEKIEITKEEVLESLEDIKEQQKEIENKNNLSYEMAKKIENFLEILLPVENQELMRNTFKNFKEMEQKSLVINEKVESLIHIEEKLELVKKASKSVEDLMNELEDEKNEIIKNIQGAYNEEKKDIVKIAKRTLGEFREKVKFPKRLILGSVIFSFMINIFVLGFFINYKNELLEFDENRKALVEFNNYMDLMKDYKTFKQLTNERLNNLKN